MNSQADRLKGQLDHFTFGTPGAALSFSQRLARENGWTAEFADRTVSEYRRFLYLAARAGHPVSPSEAVDQAWHLHLVYTESYWHDLCRDLLGFPLHHGPTRGGAAEGAKFRDWYQRTLTSYEKHFGTVPPADIWPAAPERFADAPFFQRVNLRRHWVIPKPAWLQVRWTSRPHRQPAAPWKSALERLPGLSLAALGIIVGVAGCAVSGPNSWNVFDWYGSPFLAFFAVFVVVLITILTVARLRLLNPPTPGATDLEPNLADPYEVAFLAGGLRGAIEAAVVTLGERGMIGVSEGQPATITNHHSKSPEALPPFEDQVLQRVAESTTVPSLVRALAPEGEDWERRLSEKGLVVADANRRQFRWLGANLLVLAILVGSIKIVVGLNRDRPVGFLFLMLIVTVAVMAGLTSVIPRLTRRGQSMLLRLRAQYHVAPLEELRAQASDTGLGLAGQLIPLAVGLYGLNALGTASGALPYRELQPPPLRNRPDSGCSSSSGCGSSSSGGSDGGSSGDGGGGDGGGGCGGCGGGGD